MAPPPTGGDPKDPPPIPPKSPVPPEDRLKPVPRNSRTSRSMSPTVVPASVVARLEGPEKVTERTYSPGGFIKEDVDVFEDSSVPTGFKPVPTDIEPEPSDNSEDGLMHLPKYNPGKSKPPPAAKPTVDGIKAKLAGMPRRKRTADVIAEEAEKAFEHITKREARKSTPPKGERTQPVPNLDATGAFPIKSPQQTPPAPPPPRELKSVTPAPDREARPMTKSAPKKPFEPMSKSLSRFAGEILWLAGTVLAVMVRGLGYMVIQLAEFWARLPRAEQVVIQMPRRDLVRMLEAIVDQKVRERQDTQAVLPVLLPELQLPSLAAPPPAPPVIADEVPDEAFNDWIVEAEPDSSDEDEIHPPPPPIVRMPAEALARRQQFTAAAILAASVLIPIIVWTIVWSLGGINQALHGHSINPMP